MDNCQNPPNRQGARVCAFCGEVIDKPGDFEDICRYCDAEYNSWPRCECGEPAVAEDEKESEADWPLCEVHDHDRALDEEYYRLYGRGRRWEDVMYL